MRLDKTSSKEVKVLKKQNYEIFVKGVGSKINQEEFGANQTIS